MKGLSATTRDYGNCIDVAFERSDGRYKCVRIHHSDTAEKTAALLRELADYVDGEQGCGMAST